MPQELLNAGPANLRVFRARTIRLTKAAIGGDGEYAVLSSFNIEALAYYLITAPGPAQLDGLASFLLPSAVAIVAGPTPDPAKVSPAIKFPDGITQEQAARRLSFFASCAADAIRERYDEQAVLTALSRLFPEQLSDAPRPTKDKLAAALAAGEHERRRHDVVPPADQEDDDLVRRCGAVAPRTGTRTSALGSGSSAESGRRTPRSTSTRPGGDEGEDRLQAHGRRTGVPATAGDDHAPELEHAELPPGHGGRACGFASQVRRPRALYLASGRATREALGARRRAARADRSRARSFVQGGVLAGDRSLAGPASPT